MRFLAFLGLFLLPFSALAVNIQNVKNPYGVNIWLVESHQLPMVDIDIAFKTGSVNEDKGKEGVATLTADLFKEGADTLDASAFTQSLERLGAFMNVSTGLLNTTISLRTLSDKKDDAFKLLTLALTKPRFDEEAISRLKKVMQASFKIEEQNPGKVAGKLLKEHLFPNHSYGLPAHGNKQSVEALKVNDVQKYYQQNFHKGNIVISAVGDITAAELLKQLTPLLENLKDGNENILPQKPMAATPVVVRQTMDVPQSTIYLAQQSITRDDPDYYSAYVMNYILGGGGFNSRLMEEIREKRGLAYGVYSYIEPLPVTGSFIVSVSTKNADAPTSIQLIKNEIKRLKAQGISQKEFDGAQAFLQGSFPLRIDTGRKILNYLTAMQLEGLGIDYLDMWTKRIARVTKADVERVAKRLLNEKAMVTVIVGGEAQ